MDDIFAQMQQNERRRKLLEAMQQQTAAQPIQGKYGLAQALAKVAAAYLGSKQSAALDQQQSALQQQYGDQLKGELGQFMQKFQGSPGGQPLPGPTMDGDPLVSQPTKGDPQAAIIEAMSSRLPEMQQIGRAQLGSLGKNQEKFGHTPTKGVDASGRSRLVLIGDQGTVKPIDGLGPAPEFISVGNAVFNKEDLARGSGAKPVAQAPQTPPTGMEYGPDGKLRWIESYLQGKKDIAAAGRTTISNTPIFTQEKEEAKAVGKGFGEMFTKLQDDAVKAQARIHQASRLESLLDRVNTGKLEGVKKEIAAYGQAFGIQIDPNLPEKQAFESLTQQMALEFRNPSGGAGMPGALSDGDRKFLVNMAPSLTKTKEGNKIILDTMKKLAKRDQEVARIARDYRRKRGQLDEGFYDELQEFADRNPLFQAPKFPGQQPAVTPKPGEQVLDLDAYIKQKRGGR